MQPHPFDERRQHPGIRDRLRLRPASAHRILEWAFQHHLDEEQHDKVQEQRRDHLVDAEPHLQERRAEHKEGTGERRRREDQRDEHRRRRLDRARADRDGGERACVELSLGADVVKPRPERDRGGEPGQDQGRRPGKGLGQGEDRARSALPHQAERRQDRRAGEGKRHGREREGR